VKSFLIRLIRLTGVLVIFGLMFFAIHKSYHLEKESDFVILADKVGDPTKMTIFRVAPSERDNEDPSDCSVGGDKLYTPWNVSIFTAANKGDVLKRYHHTFFYQIFGKTLLRDCYDVFMPVTHVSLYPDMNYWPFREGDLAQNDPDYDLISKLTKSQRP